MHQITPQVTSLYNALMNKGIKCELEVWDGHKHIDISIPWAKIDIEVDGLHHYSNPEQIQHTQINKTNYEIRNHHQSDKS